MRKNNTESYSEHVDDYNPEKNVWVREKAKVKSNGSTEWIYTDQKEYREIEDGKKGVEIKKKEFEADNNPPTGLVKAWYRREQPECEECGAEGGKVTLKTDEKEVESVLGFSIIRINEEDEYEPGNLKRLCTLCRIEERQEEGKEPTVDIRPSK